MTCLTQGEGRQAALTVAGPRSAAVQIDHLYPTSILPYPHTHIYGMQLLYLFIALAALVATVPAQARSWDASEMVQIGLPDDFHQQYLKIGTASMCALQSSDKGAGQ
jgi:hypothetical protein